MSFGHHHPVSLPTQPTQHMPSRILYDNVCRYLLPNTSPSSIELAGNSLGKSQEEFLEQHIHRIGVAPNTQLRGQHDGNQVVDRNYCDDEEEEEEEEDQIAYPVENVGTYGVDTRDEGTSDNWVSRHPELVRLTGRHPFNSEPPLSRLVEHGFLTPTALHYVRNHGYVPQAVFEEWTVEVCGVVKRPQKFSMRQIMEDFKPRELPVTLVCAGNRRKEQNMVKQTIGFNWGAAAVGTSVWRGARLCDVLRRCGIYSKKRGAMYVCFEGGEMLPGELGDGTKTRYGTSISVESTLDEAQDVLLAYMQNGKLLEPDHGFPVRLIIPGYIGGRMVKWLARIEVTRNESGNHYHYKDNRVLPSHVDAEKANAEGWWYKPAYIINELNINSVITTPAHGEVLPINVTTLQTSFTLRGYAYSGGGRKVIRVEVTIDGGENWKLCEVSYSEKPTKNGKYWCWCFWEIEIDVIELIQAKEVAVRAWDAAMNTQPQSLTWNVMGMMNNCWFRVRVNTCRHIEGGLGVVFEHPTRPGNQNGGWMVPQEIDHFKPMLAKSLSSPSLKQAPRLITMTEFKKHSTIESPWIVVHNNVYDCSKFLDQHPGGKDSILINAGTDCSEEFDAIHSTKAKAMLEDYEIGELVPSISAGSTPDNSVHGSMSLIPISEVTPVKPIALSSKRRKIECKLIQKEILSYDLRLFKFALPSADQILGLPVGKHIFVSAQINGKLCMRAYTPISSDDDVGYIELLVRIYFKGVHPSFPEGGLMSQHLESLEAGDSVTVKGPVGHIQYEGRGHFSVEGNPRVMRRCAMLAGGTGITPIYQLITAILKDPEDKTEVYLVYANRGEEDIMLRSQLDKWAEECDNLKVWYVISNGAGKERWAYSKGWISEEIVKEHLPPGNDDPFTVAFMCGPPPMIQFACLPNLLNHGYQDSQCFQF